MPATLVASALLIAVGLLSVRLACLAMTRTAMAGVTGLPDCALRLSVAMVFFWIAGSVRTSARARGSLLWTSIRATLPLAWASTGKHRLDRQRRALADEDGDRRAHRLGIDRPPARRRDGDRFGPLRFGCGHLRGRIHFVLGLALVFGFQRLDDAAELAADRSAGRTAQRAADDRADLRRELLGKRGERLADLFDLVPDLAQKFIAIGFEFAAAIGAFTFAEAFEFAVAVGVLAVGVLVAAVAKLIERFEFILIRTAGFGGHIALLIARTAEVEVFGFELVECFEFVGHEPPPGSRPPDRY